MLNVLPPDEIVSVRSAIPGNVAIGMRTAPGNTRCSYTSSVTTMRSCSIARSATTVSSSASNILPVGLCGVLSMISFVRGVTVARSASASNPKRPVVSAASSTGTAVAPAIVISGR